MANTVRPETIRVRNQTIRTIRQLYDNTWDDLNDEIEEYIKSIYLDDATATQQERLEHADKNGKWKLIAAFIAYAILANGKAISHMNKSFDKVYHINANDVIRYVLKEVGVKLPTKDVNIPSLLHRATRKNFDQRLSKRHVSAQVLSEIERMLRDGEGTKKIAQRLEQVFGFNKTSAFRIVLTETTRIQAHARWETMREAETRGLKFEKIWRHQIYVENPRDWHWDLDGVGVGVDDEFLTAKGNRLIYPGDPSAPAVETVSCHCFLDEKLISW